jgi:hypothetical protein
MSFYYEKFRKAVDIKATSVLPQIFFLLAVTSIIPMAAASSTMPCGLKGTVQQRIDNCDTSKMTSQGFEFTLVTRSTSGQEVWRDDDSGLLWSDSVSRSWFTYNSALKTSGLAENYHEAERVCVSPKTLAARGGLSEMSWHVPAKSDATDAEKHGFREVLPNLFPHRWDLQLFKDGGFWVTGFMPQIKYALNFAWVFQTYHGEVWTVPRNTQYQVRCVTSE